MPRSVTFTFEDPFPYQAAIRPAEVSIFPTARGNFHATLMLVDFDRLLMQGANKILPGGPHPALKKTGAKIASLADPSQSTAKYCGMELPSSAIVVGAAGSSRHRCGDAGTGDSRHEGSQDAIASLPS